MRTFFLAPQKPRSVEVPSFTTCCSESTLRENLPSSERVCNQTRDKHGHVLSNGQPVAATAWNFGGKLQASPRHIHLQLCCIKSQI